MAGWVNETATNLTFSIDVALSPVGSQTSTITTYVYSFNFQALNKTYAATASFNNIVAGMSTVVGDGKVTPAGVAASASVSGTIVNMTVPKSAIGNATTGDILSHLSVDSAGYLLGTVVKPMSVQMVGNAVELVSDHAPGTGFGRNYTVASGLPRHNGSASGTGTSSTTMTSTGTSSSTSSTPASTAPSSSTAAASSSTSSTSTSQSALDKIQANAGYAVGSAAAMGAVVLLSLIGLFGRWGA
jgi:hypothetical protein